MENEGKYLDSIVRTSKYIPQDLDYIDNHVPDYQKFTETVAMSVDSTQRGKYGPYVFYTNVVTLIDRYNIPYENTDFELTSDGTINYEGFSKSTAQTVMEHPEEYDEVFNIINGLMDEFDIPRYHAPSYQEYGEVPLIRKSNR